MLFCRPRRRCAATIYTKLRRIASLFLIKLQIFLFPELDDGVNEERNAKNGNEYGQKLALGDAVPHGGIGFLIALAGDTGGSIDEGEEC